MLLRRTLLTGCLAAGSWLPVTAQTVDVPPPFVLPDAVPPSSNTVVHPCVLLVVPADAAIGSYAYCDVQIPLTPEAYYISAVPDKSEPGVALGFQLLQFEGTAWEEVGLGVFQPSKKLWLDMLFLNLKKTDTILVRVILRGRSTRQIPVAVLVMSPPATK